jgi:hypothetical protein
VLQRFRVTGSATILCTMLAGLLARHRPHSQNLLYCGSYSTNASWSNAAMMGASSTLAKCIRTEE